MHERSKPGFFETERELIRWVQDATGTGAARNPITYLVEAADDIVNVCIDLEDGVRKKVFRWQEMIGELERWGAKGRSYGAVAKNLSMDDRMTIANMAIEAGGKNGIFELTRAPGNTWTPG